MTGVQTCALPISTFIWSGCPCRPLLVCQLSSHHHLPMLAVPLPITSQRRLFCLLAHRGILFHHGVGILSCYPSWHAPSDSNSSLLLLGSMSSQQDISLKKLEQEPHNRFSFLPTARPYPLLPLTHDPQLPVLAGYRLVMSRPYACSTSMYVQNLFAAHAFAVV